MDKLYIEIVSDTTVSFVFSNVYEIHNISVYHISKESKRNLPHDGKRKKAAVSFYLLKE